MFSQPGTPYNLNPREGATPIPEGRNPFGWMALTLLLGLMFFSQLSLYLNRSSDSSNGGLQFIREDLRRNVIVGEIERSFNFPKAPAKAKGVLDDEILALRARANESPEAAVLLAQVEFETGRRVTIAPLKPLLSSKKADERAYALIYRSDRLTKSQYDQVQRGIGAITFTSKLALAHAKVKAGVPNPRAGLVSKGRIYSFTAALVGLASALVLGCLALVVLVLSSQRSFPGHPAGRLSPPLSDAFALRASQAIALWLVIELVVGMAGRYQMGTFASSGVVTAVGTILMTLWVYRRPVGSASRGTGLDEIGARKPSLRLIGWGVLGAIANAPIVAAAALIGDWAFRFLPRAEHPIEQRLLSSPSLATLGAILLLASVQAPFFEEITFRGTIFPALSSVLKSPIWGGVLSSFLFAVIHPTGVPAWPALAAIGGMSAFLCFRTKSLIPSMTMHCVHNTATLIFALLLT